MMPSDNELVSALSALGVRHLRGRRIVPVPDIESSVLVAGLAASRDRRLRAALVPLFLWRPDFATGAAVASERLTEPALTTLMCFYSAAVALQELLAERIAWMDRDGSPLRDLFAVALCLPRSAGAEARIEAIAQRHAQRSGEDINWLGSYRKAASDFLRLSELELSCPS